MTTFIFISEIDRRNERQDKGYNKINYITIKYK